MRHRRLEKNETLSERQKPLANQYIIKEDKIFYWGPQLETPKELSMLNEHLRKEFLEKLALTKTRPAAIGDLHLIKSYTNHEAKALSSNEVIAQAIESKELLDLHDDYKYGHDAQNTDYLNETERAKYGVHIRSGVFVKNGKKFDTSSMTSKGKEGFAAFTLNANGQLAVFPHGNKIFHSSMNAGSPVVSAGTLQIKDGVLTAITLSSGHYKPTMFNIYRALEHFSLNNVDISQAKVFVTKDPSSVCLDKV